MRKYLSAFVDKYTVMAITLCFASGVTLVLFPLVFWLTAAGQYGSVAAIVEHASNLCVIPGVALLMFGLLVRTLTESRPGETVAWVQRAVLISLLGSVLASLFWAWSVTGGLPEDGQLISQWIYPANVDVPIALASAIGKVLAILGVPSLLLWSAFMFGYRRTKWGAVKR